jgi:penicillin-binding protein 1C
LRGGEPRYGYVVDARTGRRVAAGCPHGAVERREAARWPAALLPWLDAGLRQRALPPPWADGCRDGWEPEAGVKIVGITDGEILRRATGPAAPMVRLEVRGNQGGVQWMVNGSLVARVAAAQSYVYRFASAGRYDITAFDDHGRYDRVSVSVR